MRLTVPSGKSGVPPSTWAKKPHRPWNAPRQFPAPCPQDSLDRLPCGLGKGHCFRQSCAQRRKMDQSIAGGCSHPDLSSLPAIIERVIISRFPARPSHQPRVRKTPSRNASAVIAQNLERLAKSFEELRALSRRLREIIIALRRSAKGLPPSGPSRLCGKACLAPDRPDRPAWLARGAGIIDLHPLKSHIRLASVASFQITHCSDSVAISFQLGSRERTSRAKVQTSMTSATSSASPSMSVFARS